MTHRMAVLNASGHSPVEWDLEEPETVEHARLAFNNYREAGYAAFQEHVDETIQVLDFDPHAENTVFLAPIAGG